MLRKRKIVITSALLALILATSTFLYYISGKILYVSKQDKQNQFNIAAQSQTSSPLDKTINKDTYQFPNVSNNVIYSITGNNVSYAAYTKKSIDTFLIAAALYYNFNNQNILPYVDNNELYKKAKEYFSPYKDHKFIKNFSQYVSGSDVKSAYMAVLLNFTDLPDMKPIYSNPEKSFQGNDPNRINNFLIELTDFYNDANAEKFFTDNVSYYNDLDKYFKYNVENSKLRELIADCESYTGNKDRYYKGKNIAYSTVLSFYRSVGSFATLEKDDTLTLVSMQFPYKASSKRSNTLDIDSIITTSVHEYLHNYINVPVSNNKDQIDKLSSGKDRKDFASSMYISKNFPWNRITDETFVRAVEARLYNKEFGDAKAQSNIIEPEMKMGFKPLQSIYNKLADYEKDRTRYPMIDDFIPQLIDEMYK